RLASSLWFSFNFESSIICCIIFCISAALGCPPGEVALAPVGFAGTGTEPLLEVLSPGAGEVWAKDDRARDVAVKKVLTNTVVFMMRALWQCGVTRDKCDSGGYRRRAERRLPAEHFREN